MRMFRVKLCEPVMNNDWQKITVHGRYFLVTIVTTFNKVLKRRLCSEKNSTSKRLPWKGFTLQDLSELNIILLRFFFLNRLRFIIAINSSNIVENSSQLKTRNKRLGVHKQILFWNVKRVSWTLTVFCCPHVVLNRFGSRAVKLCAKRRRPRSDATVVHRAALRQRLRREVCGAR